MTEEPEKTIQRMLEKIDWEAYDARVVWSFGPRNNCYCNRCFRDWKKKGRQLYGPGKQANLEAYEKTIAEHLRIKKTLEASETLRQDKSELILTLA